MDLPDRPLWPHLSSHDADIPAITLSAYMSQYWILQEFYCIGALHISGMVAEFGLLLSPSDYWLSIDDLDVFIPKLCNAILIMVIGALVN
jgi:hypothetical protein